MSLPGETETIGDVCKDIVPHKTVQSVKSLEDRRVILLATATITDENIFANGLFQNVFVLYRMFEAMGYISILLVSEKPKSLEKIPSLLKGCRMISTEDLLKEPIIGLKAIFEIGMSIDACLRNFIKIMGGCIFKIYLGNILNIDTELPMFVPGNFFLHHSVGEVQKVFVSPHYGQHAEYASYINQVKPPKDLADMIAPYVWDPTILTREGTKSIDWVPPPDPKKQVFVIMEPNISFQKCATVPLMILEKWYRTVGKKSGWEGEVVIISGDRADSVAHFRENLKATFDLQKDSRIELVPRMTILDTMTKWPSAIFILHNYNNEFNYMTLELLWSGFPVLHNSPSWDSFGYFYKDVDLAGATKQIELVHKNHRHIREVYRAHANILAWKYSPYNPDIHARWEKLLTV
jgi:hypothetical protein